MNEKNKIYFTTTAADCKLKFAEPTTDAIADAVGQPLLVGYALTWNTTSSDRGGYVARLKSGSAQPDPDGVMLYYNHNDDIVLGNTENESLRLIPDEYGVRFESLKLPDTQAAKDTAALVKDKYVTGMSFGMYPIEWEDTEENGQKIRNYTKFLYDEISICGKPSFNSTSVGMVEHSKVSKSQHTDTPARDAAALKLAEIELEEISID